jgi:hypothetical protein
MHTRIHAGSYMPTQEEILTYAKKFSTVEEEIKYFKKINQKLSLQSYPTKVISFTIDWSYLCLALCDDD